MIIRTDSALRQLKTTLMQFVNLSRVIDMVRVKDGLDLPSLDWPTFAWCVAVCMTRQNRVQVDGGNDEENSELVLIPVWDLCNHRRGEVCMTCLFLVHGESKCTDNVQR